MGCSKLREWVGTVTGKGDRWGRDRLGRSAPAFLSTIALPHLPARREADVIWQLLFAAKPANWWPCVLRPEPGGESAGCVCLQCLFCGLCACCHFCLPCPLPSSSSCPVQFALPPSIHLLHFACPRSCPCAPGSPFSRASSLFFSQGQQFASC